MWNLKQVISYKSKVRNGGYQKLERIRGKMGKG
jgi:hypothetical protein